MPKLRLPLWQLMMAVVVCGVVFAALKNPSQAVAGWVFLGTLAILLLGIVGLVSRRGRTQLSYLGFTLFGLGYLVLTLTSGALKPPLLPTVVPIDRLFYTLHPQVQVQTDLFFDGKGTLPLPLTDPTPQRMHDAFLVISHSLMTLLSGVLGFTLARLCGTKPTEQKGTTP